MRDIWREAWGRDRSTQWQVHGGAIWAFPGGKLIGKLPLYWFRKAGNNLQTPACLSSTRFGPGGEGKEGKEVVAIEDPGFAL